MLAAAERQTCKMFSCISPQIFHIAVGIKAAPLALESFGAFGYLKGLGGCTGSSVSFMKEQCSSKPHVLKILSNSFCSCQSLPGTRYPNKELVPLLEGSLGSDSEGLSHKVPIVTEGDASSFAQRGFLESKINQLLRVWGSSEKNKTTATEKREHSSKVVLQQKRERLLTHPKHCVHQMWHSLTLKSRQLLQFRGGQVAESFPAVWRMMGGEGAAWPLAEKEGTKISGLFFQSPGFGLWFLFCPEGKSRWLGKARGGWRALSKAWQSCLGRSVRNSLLWE